MKNILITGCSGFLGLNLLKNFRKKYNIIGIDDFSSSHPNALLDDITFIKQSICDPITINEEIDVIINAACIASPWRYQEKPLHVLDTNYVGTKNILEFALDKKAKLIHLSTSEIYGDPLINPQPESYYGNVNPIGPRSCYDEGKRIAETLCYEYNSKHQLDIQVLRLFNTYGPYMLKNDGRVVSNFINQALENKDITIFGKGTQTRSLCYVDDTVNAIEKAIALTGFNIFNVGNPHEITILDIANIILTLTNSDSQLIYHKLPQDDPLVRQPNIEKIKSLIQWEPITKLHDGLTKTIKYFLELNR
jgi:nucleoside-diphosphate-sugar epimerase